MNNVALTISKLRLTSLQQAYTCITVLLIAACAYLYFLNVSVVHVVVRKEHTQEMNQLHADIAMLETSYIDAQHKISDRMAIAGQYDEHAEKIFIVRGTGADLALRNN
jgi:hypothetical protein